MAYLKIRSRHPSHDILRGKIKVGKRNMVFRLGSNTPMPGAIDINSADACMNSANKRVMKVRFTENQVKTAVWTFPQNVEEVNTFINQNELRDKKVIIKSLRGSRGRGLYLLENGSEAAAWFNQRGFGGHIIEKYYNYTKEYRLHVSKEGCFYTCRKMLKTEAQERWYRNDSNCVWIMEENPMFEKPSNWAEIVEHCVKALNATELDLGACDVRVQSERIGRVPEFIICEINSAPSFGDVTAEKYIQELTKIVANV